MDDYRPAQVLIFRHAEKTGIEIDLELSDEGWERARKLAAYIPRAFGTPDVIFAASPSERSVRPTQTVEPLAAATGVSICEAFGDGDGEALCKHVIGNAKSHQKRVAICWRHGELDQLAARFGAPGGSYPSPWPNDLYDLIICIDYRADGAAHARAVRQPF